MHVGYKVVAVKKNFELLSFDTISSELKNNVSKSYPSTECLKKRA